MSEDNKEINSIKEMFKSGRANEVRFKAIGLTTIEDLDSTPGWIHGDGRRIIPGLYPEKGFLIVKPI